MRRQRASEPWKFSPESGESRLPKVFGCTKAEAASPRCQGEGMQQTSGVISSTARSEWGGPETWEARLFLTSAPESESPAQVSSRMRSNDSGRAPTAAKKRVRLEGRPKARDNHSRSRRRAGVGGSR